MVFNEVTKNYDDHVKNISFLMNKKGEWPAYAEYVGLDENVMNLMKGFHGYSEYYTDTRSSLSVLNARKKQGPAYTDLEM